MQNESKKNFILFPVHLLQKRVYVLIIVFVMTGKDRVWK